MRCVRRQARRRGLVLKISADWNASDCISLFMRRGGCIAKRYSPLHRRRHHCCHSDHWQEAAHRTAQQNCDSARNSCGLLCPYRVMPGGFYTESSKCSDISSPLRRTPNRILGRRVATVTFQLRSSRPLPISPTLSAADLTEIWARCTRC